MLKKFVRIMVLFSVCLFAGILPVYADSRESVTLSANGNTANVVLTQPQTEGNDEIYSMQMGLKIETKQGDATQNKVSFQFDSGITSSVRLSRYQADTGILTLYISGKQNLYQNPSIVLGKVVLESSAKDGVSASVSVVEDSFKRVNGAFHMQEAAVNVSQPVDLSVGNGGREPIVDIKPTPDDNTDKKEPSGGTDNRKKQSMKVNTSALTFTIGDKAKTLKVSKAQGKVTYKSSNSKVAKVTSKGKVTPKAVGKATITVKAAGNSAYKEKSVKVSVVVKPVQPAQVKNVSVKSTSKKGSATVTWKKAKGASGYQIRYYYDKSMKTYSTVDVKNGKSLSKTLKQLDSGKNVYIKVRAYTTKKGVTSYGKWSKRVRSTSKIR